MTVPGEPRAPPTWSKSQEKDILRKTARIRTAAMALCMPAIAIGCQWIHLTRVPPRLQKNAARRSRIRARGRSRFDRSFAFPPPPCTGTTREKTNRFQGYMGGKCHAITKGGISFLALFLYFLLVFSHTAIIFFIWQKKEEEDAMSVRTAKGLLAVCLVLSIGFIFGCAGMEYAPNKGIAYYHRELPAAARAL